MRAENEADRARIRWLKENDIVAFCLERRRRRRLRRRYIGFNRETREWLDMTRHDPCTYCGGKANTIDHVIPRSKGGSNNWDNLVWACSECNNRKGSLDLEEFLRREKKRKKK